MIKRTLMAFALSLVAAFGAVDGGMAQQLPMTGTPMVGVAPDCGDESNKQQAACRGRMTEETKSFVLGTVNAPAGSVTYKDIVNPKSKFYRRTQSFVPSDPKLRVIYDAARGVGIRAGYADEAERINKIVRERYTKLLDSRYNFSSLMIQKYVVPPVITQITNVQEASGRLLYFSNSSYEIVKEARLSMNAPNWRTYLTLPIQPIAAPQGLSVETAEEEKAWREGAATGWYAGIAEARRGFQTSWNILNRDFGGMKRYAVLAKQGVVSLPNLSTEISKWRVTEGGTRAHSGERTLRLVVSPKFRGRKG